MTKAQYQPSGWPVLRTEAPALGVSGRTLRGAEFRTVFAGVVVHATIPDTIVVRSRAAVLLAPEGAIISHFTAARMWGGRVPDNEWTHVSFMRDVRFRVRGIKPHRYRRRLDIRKRHGLEVTSPEQTFCDMARYLGLVDLVALGDSLVRKKRFSPEHLVQYAQAWSGQFASEVVTAARLVRSNVDSSPETALRVLMVLAGFPEPEIDIHIDEADGTTRYRIDMGYKRARLAIEYDGKWHDTLEQRAKDESRRTELEVEDDWTFVIVTGDDLYGDTEGLVQRLRAAAREAGVEVPPQPSQAWRQHFRVVYVSEQAS